MQNKRLPSRRAAATLLLAIAWVLPAQLANARYMMPELVNIPVERVIRNLELLARKDPGNAEARFNLARAHAMAYALRGESVQVWKGRENAGVWFGFEPPHIPFTVKPIDDSARLNAANAHLAKALERYVEVLELAPNNLAAALGYAWCTEQSGQKRKAVKRYRKVIKAAWEKEKDLKHGGLGGHSVTAEAAAYLIPLLDSEKDKEEIKTLQERIKQMKALPRPVTPIVVSLRNGAAARDLENHSARVAFDADGTGLQKHWTWITRDAGWLVYDPHNTGKITSGLQLFGGVTFWMFWANGYQALAALDDDGDGMLTGRELKGLAIWQDLNGNGICERGDVRPLSEWGIVALSCRYVRDAQRPDRIAYSPRGVFFRGGFSRPTYDIILHPAIATVE